MYKKDVLKSRLHEISPYCVLHKYLLHSISASISRGAQKVIPITGLTSVMCKKIAFSITIGFNYTFHASLDDIFCRGLGVDTKMQIL